MKETLKRFCQILFFLFIPLTGIHSQATSEEIEYRKDSIKIIQLIKKAGNLYRADADKETYNAAFSLLKKANALAQKHNLTNSTIDINNKYAEFLSFSGNYSMSLEYLFKNLTILDDNYLNSKKLDILKKRMYLYGFIGYCYVSLENADKALIYLNQSLDLIDKNFSKSKDEYIFNRKLAVLNNAASAYLLKKDINKAREYYLKAIEYVKKVKNLEYLSALYNNLGICEKYDGKLSKSKKYFEMGLQLRLKTNDTLGLAQSYNNLGTHYLDEKHIIKAIDNFKKGLYFSRKSFGIRSEMFAANYLSLSYAELKDYPKAYEMMLLFNKLNDSIMSIDRLRSINQLELKYQFEREKKEYDLKQQIYKAQNERKFLILITLIIVLLLSSIVFILLYRNQRILAKRNELMQERLLLESKNLNLGKDNLELNNKQLELVLDHKNKELTTQVMYLLKKNEFLSVITEQLIDLRKIASETDKNKYNKLILDIRNNIDESAWNEFEVRFQNVHKDFIDKLYQVYPSLTPNETKLCSFLKLNMSTKDISALTFQSTKSIEVARTRLRKKIGMDRDENLVSFLQKL